VYVEPKHRGRLPAVNLEGVEEFEGGRGVDVTEVKEREIEETRVEDTGAEDKRVEDRGKPGEGFGIGEVRDEVEPERGVKDGAFKVEGETDRLSSVPLCFPFVTVGAGATMTCLTCRTAGAASGLRPGVAATQLHVHLQCPRACR
jgi:hypothetical protein